MSSNTQLLQHLIGEVCKLRLDVTPCKLPSTDIRVAVQCAYYMNPGPCIPNLQQTVILCLADVVRKIQSHSHYTLDSIYMECSVSFALWQLVRYDEPAIEFHYVLYGSLERLERVHDIPVFDACEKILRFMLRNSAVEGQQRNDHNYVQSFINMISTQSRCHFAERKLRIVIYDHDKLLETAIIDGLKEKGFSLKGVNNDWSIGRMYYDMKW